MSTTRKGSFRDLNAFYVFGACTVLVIHILGFFVQEQADYPGNYDLEALSLILLRFGRSLFIFGTGMLLFYWYKHKKMDWSTFWKKRWHNIMIPYMVWTGIYTFVKLQTFAPDVYLPAFLESLLTGNSFYHLYYIPLFLQLNLLFMLTKSLLERYMRFSFVVGVFALQSIIYVLFIRFPETGILDGITEASPLWLQAIEHGYTSAQNYPYMYLFYFVLGAYAGLYPDVWRNAVQKYSQWSFLICLAATLYLSLGFLGDTISYGEALNIFSPVYLTYTTAFILLFYPISARLGQSPLLGDWLARLAKYNLAIYLVHPFVLFMLESYVIFRLDWSNFSLIIAMFAITLPLSIMIFSYRLPLFRRRHTKDGQPAFRIFHA